MEDERDSKYKNKTFIVPIIKSFDHYDFARAKIACSLTWLVAKAFGSDCIPEELEETFYKDQYDQEHLKPPVASLLLSAELYCRAGSLILRSDAARPLLGHNGVIQALAQKGLYVTDQERLVTERDLCKTPIQMSSHLAMIDTLMMAYTLEMISVERVLTCVQKYSPFFPEEDFPYDAEEAVTIWFNKVNGYLRETITCAQRVGKSLQVKPAGKKYNKEDLKPQPLLYLPLVDNLLKDNTDGCALAALLHFYCPNAVPLEDICMKETMSLADSLYNLQLVQDFCRKNLNNCCHFTLEDMLYASSSIKCNYLVFMAELFWWFEVVKPSFVEPRKLEFKVEATKMTKCDLIHRLPSPNSPESPNLTSSDMMKRSNTLPYVDRCVGTWPKEKRSSGHGISFEIPFDDPIACKPVKLLSRAASSDGLGFKVSRSARGMRRNLSFQPINGSIQSPLQEEANDVTSPHGALGPLVGTDFTRYSNGTNPDVTTPPPPTPTIEEALKIIHESECSNSSLCPRIGQNAFFLHPPESQSHNAAYSDLQDPEDDLSKAQVNDGKLNSTSTDLDTGIHICTEDIQDGYDEESSLKDYSDMDQDYETRSCSLPNTGGSFSPAPSLKGQHSLAESSTSSIGSFVPVRMTNFAEQKSRKLNHVEGQSGGHTLETYICTPTARQVARSVTPDFQSQARSPRDPSSRLVSEMVQLKMKLEEKRRAIEAQKKKVEAVFTRHRQRMGRTAFLNVVHRKGTILPVEGGSCKRLDEEKNIQPQLLLTKNSNSQLESSKPDWAPPKLTLVKGESAELVNLAEYTRSIERLNASLNFLQTEMQRLAQQQEHIMDVREQQAKVITPSHMQTQTSLQKHLCERHSSSAVGRGSVGSLSPNLSTKGSPRSTQCSPALIKRKSASFHARTPRTPRASDLKITPFSRMLNTAQSVDSLPRLRRFAPCQSQTSSFVYLGHDETPTDENHTNKEEVAALTVGSMNKQADTDADEISVDVLPNQVTEIQDEKEEKAKTNHLDIKEISSELLRPLKTTVAFEAQSETVRELLHVICTDSTGDGKDLIEVPISELEPMDNLKLESGKGTDYRLEKMCCGFFYRDDHKGEQDIAQKKAALMEKRLRREKEMKMKKQLLEGETEQKKEMSRLKAEEDCQKKEDEEKARRELIKNEYLTRRQLKLMEDMDSIIKPRLPSIKQKKPRTKSMHRDIMVPKVPAQSHTGSRPQGYSVSSISLASLNLADSGNVHIDKRISRPEIIDGQLSLFPTANQNGEKWENESTSSAASNTDYTGPKLYKEPSAKSNKYIIQNALSHCCLAGKVNEGQKNRILQEIEKTESRNFLILFRDPRCQFRSLYTYCLETEEISKLIGIGPKTIMPRMIENLYKYSSDKKQFCYIPAKTISASIDAITIYNHLWQTKKQSTAKKLLK